MDSTTVLVRALLAYAVYEFNYEGGTATRIELSLQPRSCLLVDNGRGIGLHRDGYVTGLVEQLTGHQSKVALHGLGLAIVAMSAPRMVVQSRRNGLLYTQEFAWGVADGAVRTESSSGGPGTHISVVFPDDAPGIDFGAVIAQADWWQKAHPGLEIHVTCDGATAP